VQKRLLQSLERGSRGEKEEGEGKEENLSLKRTFRGTRKEGEGTSTDTSLKKKSHFWLRGGGARTVHASSFIHDQSRD